MFHDVNVFSIAHFSCSLRCHSPSGDGDWSCASAVVIVESRSSFVLHCQGDAACIYLMVFGSSNGTDTQMDVTCTGGYEDATCFGAFISGGSGSIINVVCTGDTSATASYSCSHTEVSVGWGGTIDISCLSSTSCYYATIDGRDAAELQVHGCTGWISCRPITGSVHFNLLVSCLLGEKRLN